MVPDAGICAAAQQQPGQVRLSSGRGKAQGSDTLTVLGIDLSLPIQHQFRHFSMTVPGGLHQGRPTGVVPDIRIRPPVQQQPGDLRKSLIRREGESRLAARASGSDASAALQQFPHRLDSPPVGGHSQERLALTGHRIHIHSRRQESVDDGNVVLTQRQPQGRPTLVAPGVETGASVDEPPGHFGVTMERGVDERRPPLLVRPVRIGPSRQQDLDRRLVPFQGGMNQERSTRRVGCIDPFPGREERFDDLCVVVPDGQIQSRLAPFGFQPGVRPRRQKRRDHVRLSLGSRLHQRGPALAVEAVHGGARPDQSLDDGCEAVVRRRRQGPVALLVPEAGGGAVGQQESSHFGLPPRRRMHQERDAVDVHLIDVGPVADQQDSRPSVALEQSQGQSRPIIPAPGLHLGSSFE